MGILTVRVSDSNEAINKIKKFMQLYRRFTPQRYVACLTPEGLVFVPLVSSRHSHTICIVLDVDAAEYSKIIEAVKKMGFEVIESCMYRPEPA